MSGADRDRDVDASLNDQQSRQITYEDVAAAIDGARSGPVPEGAVGGGTGMVAYQFKGGIGNSSRRLPADQGGWTVGVIVQANHGTRPVLKVDGVPVGREIPDLLPGSALPPKSIIIVAATDAPLLPNQLFRIAKRCSMGLARTGCVPAFERRYLSGVLDGQPAVGRRREAVASGARRARRLHLQSVSADGRGHRRSDHQRDDDGRDDDGPKRSHCARAAARSPGRRDAAARPSRRAKPMMSPDGPKQSLTDCTGRPRRPLHRHEDRRSASGADGADRDLHARRKAMQRGPRRS